MMCNLLIDGCKILAVEPVINNIPICNSLNEVNMIVSSEVNRGAHNQRTHSATRLLGGPAYQYLALTCILTRTGRLVLCLPEAIQVAAPSTHLLPREVCI